jgi:hypothetical protein
VTSIAFDDVQHNGWLDVFGPPDLCRRGACPRKIVMPLLSTKAFLYRPEVPQCPFVTNGDTAH